MLLRNISCLTVVAGLCVAGCAGMLRAPEPPHLSVTAIDLVDASLFEQRFNVKLRVQNPNDFDLSITGMSYGLEINDRPFATGSSNRELTIPRFGSGTMDVEAVTTLLGVLKQLKEFAQGDAAAVRYRFRGAVYLRPGSYKVPFDEKGEIPSSF